MATGADGITRVAVIGTGTIGASWAALFLAHGLDVVASDPAPDAEAKLAAFVGRALPDIAAPAGTKRGRLSFERDPAKAVAGIRFVQENAPEREGLKADLIAELQAAAPADAIIASSTTAFPHSTIAAKARDKTRVIVAHPFNPPHLVPLVELVGSAPDVPAITEAVDFYKRLGREPVVLKKEAVGHLANRFQAAVMREALYCLEQGLADVEDIDRALRYGPGLRWSFMGPFETYHLAGGAGGIRHYFAHLGASQAKRWAALGSPTMTPELTQRVIDGVDAMTKGQDVGELEARRDARLKAVTKAIADAGRKA
jgi:3-hydroxyacyl-CoA dehydrogenase